MNGRAMSAILLLLVLLAAGLVSTPALSGEHPWDSDSPTEQKGDVTTGLWDTRVADSAQVDAESEIDGTEESSPAPSEDDSMSSLMLGWFTAITIGI